MSIVPPRRQWPRHARILFAGFVLSTLPAFSQQPTRLSLDELIGLAITNNADLTAMRQRLPEARGALHQASLRPNPELNGSIGSGAAVGNSGLWGGEIGVSQTLELGGKRLRRIGLAKSELKSAEWEIRDRERLLRFEMRSAFIEALAAARNLVTIGGLLEIAEESLRLVDARVAQGESPPLERSLSLVEVNRLRADQTLAAGQHERALITIRQLAGMPPSEPLALHGDLAPQARPQPLESLIANALASRPDLQGLRQSEQSGGAALQLERSQAIPNLTGFARFTYDYDRFPQLGLIDRDRMLNLGVNIALPFRNRNQGNIETSAARLEAARLRRQYGEASVAREVRTAANRLAAALEAEKLFAQGVIGQADGNLRIVRGAYELGELRLFDVLNEQRRLTDTQRTYTEILKEAELASASLERAIGIPIARTNP